MAAHAGTILLLQPRQLCFTAAGSGGGGGRQRRRPCAPPRAQQEPELDLVERLVGEWSAAAAQGAAAGVVPFKAASLLAPPRAGKLFGRAALEDPTPGGLKRLSDEAAKVWG